MQAWFPIPVFAALLLSSCGWDGDEEEPEVSATAPRLVGRVASVNEVQRFVLVEGYGEWQLGEGLILSSLGEGRAANLVASGERMGRFAAADIQGGEVRAGDQVYARPLKAEPGDSPATSPVVPEPGSAHDGGLVSPSD